MGPNSPQGRTGPSRSHRTVPYAAPPRGPPHLVVPEGAELFAGEGVPTRQRAVQAGTPQSAGGGVREGVGPDHDRRSEGVFRGGAGADGGDLLGGGDGEESEGIRRDARVPARCGSEGGEGVRGGVPL